MLKDENMIFPCILNKMHSTSLSDLGLFGQHTKYIVPSFYKD